MKDYFLEPGVLVFSEKPLNVTTTLGSCVCVCIFDHKLKVGGICHYSLPYMKKKGDNPNKYGDYAISNLLKRFKTAGSKPEHLTSKIIGGGCAPDIGKENIKLAIKKLSQFHIKILAKSVGGFYKKKIRFDTLTGDVKWKKIENQNHLTSRNRPEKIKILIIDDSPSIRKIIKNMIERDSSFVVIGEAENPIQALNIMKEQRPDVITLDIKMPEMDGVTFLEQHMQKDPIPTIMITSLNYNDSGPVFQALELGALDYIKKPTFSEIDSLSSDLHEKLKNAYLSRDKLKKSGLELSKETISTPEIGLQNYLIAIGASTGGTEAIKEILVRLPKNIPPIVIVQHIPPFFSKAFAERLNSLCEFEVKEARDGQEIKCGNVIIAEGGKQMKVEKRGGRILIRVTDDPPMNRFMPSVDYLFHSVAGIENKKIIGVLLTGMGEDGADGLCQLKNKGAMTIAQDEPSSVVYGMPKAAVQLGAALKVASLYAIPNLIATYINRRHKIKQKNGDAKN